MEVMERRNVYSIIGLVILLICTTVEGQRNNTRMSYVCPPNFIRLGHSCYFFSDNNATWQDALFSCKDKDSNLSVPARWEDRNLRKYLNKASNDKQSRWIGGVYDYGSRAWKWGGELRRMHYQSFSKMKKMSPEELQFHCIAMMPELLFRWAPRSCLEKRHYICQTKLKKLPKTKVKDLRRRWQRMGKINEITVPMSSREGVDRMVNDVTYNPSINHKSFDLRSSPLQRLPKYGYGNRGKNYQRNHDLRPNELKKRSRPTASSRLTRPFPGYSWNRRDPEGSYNRNVELLMSGRTGLSPQQIKAQLARLQRLRDKHMNMKNKKGRVKGDWLVNEKKSSPPLIQTRARTYTEDNNISALHPKTIVEEFDMFPPPQAMNLPTPARAVVG